MWCSTGFLDASSHLYMRLCPSVRRTVRQSLIHSSETCKTRSKWSGMIGNRMNYDMGLSGRDVRIGCKFCIITHIKGFLENTISCNLRRGMTHLEGGNDFRSSLDWERFNKSMKWLDFFDFFADIANYSAIVITTSTFLAWLESTHP